MRGYLPKGADTIWPTEMLNSRKLPLQKVGETLETLRDVEETHLVPQILGNDEQHIRQSVEILEKWGASGIDINMGCPVSKALRHNYGVSLMGDLRYAAEVVAMTKRSSNLLVSVKLRSGFSQDREYLKNFVVALEEAGADWITLHPRLAKEGRRGEARWEEIAFVRDQLRIAVVGNGDIQEATDVFAMRSQTSCDAVMIGRAMTARPWIFWQVGEELGWPSPQGRECDTAPRTPIHEGREYGRMIQTLIGEFSRGPSPQLALRQLQFFIRTGSVWLEFGHNFYARMTKVKTLQEASEVSREFFAGDQRMMGRTQLRQ